MTQKQKYYVAGAAALGLIAFLSYKAFAKKKPKTLVNPVKPKSKPKIIVGPATGGFELPADVTTRSGTRLRSESNTNSAILKTYNAGVKLLVIDNTTESDGQWFKVKDSYGNSGWMRSDVVDYKITTTSTNGTYDSSYSDYYSYLDQIHGL